MTRTPGSFQKRDVASGTAQTHVQQEAKHFGQAFEIQLVAFARKQSMRRVERVI